MGVKLDPESRSSRRNRGKTNVGKGCIGTEVGEDHVTGPDLHDGFDELEVENIGEGIGIAYGIPQGRVQEKDEPVRRPARPHARSGAPGSPAPAGELGERRDVSPPGLLREMVLPLSRSWAPGRGNPSQHQKRSCARRNPKVECKISHGIYTHEKLF